MPFTVQWLKGDEIVVERQFDQLPNAKRAAKNQLGGYRRQKGVNSALVRDVEGNILLQVF